MLVDGHDGPDGHQVVARQQRRWPRLELQEAGGRLAGVVDTRPPVRHEARVIVDAGRLQAQAVAGQALARGADAGPAGDDADASMPDCHQVLDGHACRLLIVQQDRRHWRSGDEPVEEHEGRARAHQVIQVGVRIPRGRQDEAVDVSRTEQPEVGLLAHGVLVSVGKDEGESARLDDILDAAHDGGEEGVPDIGGDQRDGMRPSGLQAAGHRVGLVAELLHRLLDALAEGVRDHARAVGDMRYGTDGDARTPGHISGGSHWSHRSGRLRNACAIGSIVAPSTSSSTPVGTVEQPVPCR